MRNRKQMNKNKDKSIIKQFHCRECLLTNLKRNFPHTKFIQSQQTSKTNYWNYTFSFFLHAQMILNRHHWQQSKRKITIYIVRISIYFSINRRWRAQHPCKQSISKIFCTAAEVEAVATALIVLCYHQHMLIVRRMQVHFILQTAARPTAEQVTAPLDTFIRAVLAH